MTSSTTLNQSGVSRHPCLVPDLWGKAYNILPLIGFLYMTFIKLKYIPFIPTFWPFFFMERCYICHFFSKYIEMVILILSLSLLTWRIPRAEEPGGLPSIVSHRIRHHWSELAAAAACVLICGFEPSLHARVKSHLAMMYDHLSMLLNSVC